MSCPAPAHRPRSHTKTVNTFGFPSGDGTNPRPSDRVSQSRCSSAPPPNGLLFSMPSRPSLNLTESPLILLTCQLLRILPNEAPPESMRSLKKSRIRGSRNSCIDCGHDRSRRHIYHHYNPCRICPQISVGRDYPNRLKSADYHDHHWYIRPIPRR